MEMLNFYSRILREYYKYGFHNSNKILGTLKFRADSYATDILEYGY